MAPVPLAVMTIEAEDRMLGDAPLWLSVTCKRVGAKTRAYGCLGLVPPRQRPGDNCTPLFLLHTESSYKSANSAQSS